MLNDTPLIYICVGVGGVNSEQIDISNKHAIVTESKRSYEMSNDESFERFKGRRSERRA